MNIVVAGGTGFIGRYVTRALIDAGHTVAVLSRDPSTVARMRMLDGAEARRADVTDAASLAGTLAGANAVIGAVGFPNYPMEQPRKGHTFHRYEVEGTRNLLTEARSAGVTKYLYVSGASSTPTSPKPWYRAKGLAEEEIKRSGLEYCLLRPSWVYGPEDKALNKFVAIARVSPVVPIPAPVGRSQRVQPVYVGDIASAVTRIFEIDAAWNETIEVGRREVWTMHDVVHTMCGVLGRNRMIVSVPAPLVKLATAPLVVLPKPPLTPGAVDFAIQDGLVDITAAERLLGFVPLPLEEGLAKYLVT